jgi:hypothetical protein
MEGWSMGKVVQIMYTYVSKCKNDKIKISKWINVGIKKNIILGGRCDK